MVICLLHLVSILPRTLPFFPWPFAFFSMHSRWNGGRRLDIHGCGGRLSKNMNTCTHIAVDRQRVLIFRHQQCCIFPTLLTWMFQLTSTAGSKLSKSHAFKVFEYLSKTRWKEGEDFSQAIRWWDDMGNVDPPVDACIFPLDHQALQEFSYHQHMSSVNKSRKTRSHGMFQKKKVAVRTFLRFQKTRLDFLATN